MKQTKLQVEETPKQKQQYKDFIAGIKAIANKYNILQDETMECAREALAKSFKQEYGYEPYLEISQNKEDQTISFKVYKVVVTDDNEVDDEGKLTLEEAQEINPDYKIGDHILDENAPVIDLSAWSRKTINVFNQILTQKCREIMKNKLVIAYASKIGKLAKGIVEGVSHSKGFVVRLLDGNMAYLPEKYCSPNDKIEVNKNNHIKFIIQNVSEGAKTSEFPILLSRNTDAFVLELFKNLVPELQEKLIDITQIVRVAGTRTKLVVRSYNSYIRAVGALLGPNEERINAIKNETGNERIEIVLWTEDKKEFINRVVRPVEPHFVVDKMEQNDDGDDIKVSYIVVDEENIGRVIGPKWINMKLLTKVYGNKWVTISLEEAKAKGIEEPVVAAKTSSTLSSSFSYESIENKQDEIEQELNELNTEDKPSEPKMVKEKVATKTPVIKKTVEDDSKPKTEKIDFSQSAIFNQEKSVTLSLEDKLEEEEKRRIAREENSKKPKFSKWSKPVIKKTSNEASEQEIIKKQNEMLAKQWNKNAVSENELEDDLIDDLDENIDLEDYDKFYDKDK